MPSSSTSLSMLFKAKRGASKRLPRDVADYYLSKTEDLLGAEIIGELARSADLSATVTALSKVTSLTDDSTKYVVDRLAADGIVKVLPPKGPDAANVVGRLIVTLTDEGLRIAG